MINLLQDEELITRYQKLGDLQSLELLLDRYIQKTFSFFKRMTRCREDAQDLSQEVLLRIVKTANTGQVIRNFANFHFIVCRHISFDYLRKKKISRRFASLSEEENLFKADQHTYMGWTLQHNRISCEILENAITHCLAGIKEMQKRNILSDYLHGYSTHEISRRNRCTEAMAAGYWHRHKTRLFARLAAYLDQTN